MAYYKRKTRKRKSTSKVVSLSAYKKATTREKAVLRKAAAIKSKLKKRRR